MFLFFTGPKNRQRFLSEVRIQGHNYVGAGNSTNKKDSQANAAKDFVQYLVRQGHVSASDLPVDVCYIYLFFICNKYYLIHECDFNTMLFINTSIP